MNRDTPAGKASVKHLCGEFPASVLNSARSLLVAS